MTVSLGMPELPPARLAERAKTRQLNVGGVLVGGGAPISVQSMTTTVTADINGTLQQIAELTATGCQIVRVAVPDPVDAEALATIVRKSTLPVIADIHFQSKYIFAAIDAGCAAVRVNPGNIREFDGKVGEVRTGVLYEKSHSVVKCDYIWKRTDMWINFPWSDKDPVTQRDWSVKDA